MNARVSRFLIRFLLLIFASVGDLSAFELNDSHPNSPAFKAHFMASYGVNAAIEPTLTEDDREVYERILPHLDKSPERAIQILDSERSTDNPAFDFILGNLYYQLQQWEDATFYLTKAVKEMPDFRRAQRTLALCYTQLDEVENAIQSWRRVIQLGGGDEQSYGLLGYLLLTQSKYESALAAYQQALMFWPDSVDFRRGYAQCLLSTHQYGRAIALFDELLAEDESVSDYWLLQANAYLAVDDHENARNNLVVATGFEGVRAQTWALLGDLYLNEGMIDAAVDAYTHGLPLETDSKRMVLPLGHLIQVQSFNAAQVYLDALDQNLSEEDRDLVRRDLGYARAAIDFDQGHSGRVVQALLPLAEENPLDGKVLLLLADSYLSLNDYAPAVFYYERAMLLPSYKVEALLRLARLYVANSELEKAESVLKEAYELDESQYIERYLAEVRKAIGSF